MMEEVELCLRPGGLAIFVDFDALFCREDQISRYPMVESNEGGSWLVRCSHGAYYSPIFPATETPLDRDEKWSSDAG